MGGIFFILIRGQWADLLGPELFELDLLTILIAYLFCFYGDVGAGLFAVGQGLLIDLFSGGFHGLFSSLYLSVLAAIYFGSLFFDLQTPRGQILLVSLGVVVKKILFFMLIKTFITGAWFSESFLWISAASVLCTGLPAPLFFRLFDYLRTTTTEHGGPSQGPP